jgi:hypothetical protein
MRKLYECFEDPRPINRRIELALEADLLKSIALEDTLAMVKIHEGISKPIIKELTLITADRISAGV